MNTHQGYQIKCDNIVKLYGGDAMLSVVKAWRYSAPDKEMEMELDRIIKTVEQSKKAAH